MGGRTAPLIYEAFVRNGLESVGRKSEAPSAIFGCGAAARQKCRYIPTMSDDCRNCVPGRAYVFTVNLANRPSDLLVRQIETLRASIRAVRLATPFHTDAWVVIPDHMYCILTLPEGDTDHSGRWRAMKKRFSKALPNVELIRPEVLACE